MIFFYIDSKGSQKWSKVLQYPKENIYYLVFLFSDKVLAIYHEIEIYLHIYFSFGVMQKVQNI